MQTKKALVITGGVLAAVVIALLVVPSFIDWGKYQSIAQQKVKAATGYDLAINGSLRMAILPSPHANISNVVVKKPVQGREDVFLTFENADVRLAFLPLLVGKVEVASVTLEKPVVTLVTYKDGQDNYKPVTAKVEAAAIDPTTGKPTVAQATTSSGENISINGVRIKDGKVIIRNEATNTAQQINIKDLHIKADTLSGPFDGDGEIGYNDADFDVSLNTGGYKAGETLPVQLNASDKKGRAELKWSGVVATGDKQEVQGEINASFGDLAGLLADAGIAASVPSLGEKTQISGMLTANPDHVSLTNGKVQVGKTRFNGKLDASGLKSNAMTVNAVFETNDMLDVDAMMKVANKVAAQRKEDQQEAKETAKPTAPAKAASTGPLLPADFALPAAMKGDVQIRAKGISYHEHSAGALEVRLTAADGKGDAHATLADLPGGGNMSVTASTATKGTIQGSVIASVSSLKTVLSDWLKVVDAKTFDNPVVPRRLDTESDFVVSGNTATANIKNLSLGEPKIDGTVSYSTGTRPLVYAKLNGTLLTLPSDEAPKEDKKTDAKTDGKINTATTAAPQKTNGKIDFDFNPPQLPFDLKFDVSLQRLAKGDFAVSDIKAVGFYDGKGLTLSSANGTVNGGTISAAGTIADLKALSGIDAQAGLKTSDLESFVQAMTGKPLALPQKIGDFSGQVKAKGDRKQMNVDATAQAQGYTVSAAGTLDDPFSPEIPGTMNVRIRHNDLVSAIRVFSPGFGNTSGTGNKPVDLQGTAKINGKVYAFDNLKGVLGASDIAGSLKADMSGAVPSITADISSNNLDVGSFVGVSSKSAARTAAAGSNAGVTTTTSSNGGAGQWSREPMDTGMLKAMAVDIKVNAKTLTYGTWTLGDAKAGVNMKDGTLKVSPLSGTLYGGTLDGTLNADSAGAGQPLNLAFKADVKSVNIASFMQALTSSATKRADGTGSVAIDIKGTGISSAALMSSLAGKVSTQAKSLIVYGMDIDKLASNIVEAFDGGWKGVLTSFAGEGLSSGQSKFKDVDETFPITNGDMAIKNFKLETTNGNAIVVTNGDVSFADWMMNLTSNVQVTQPKDVPVISMKLAGPLDSPQKSVNSQALDNLVRAKIGNKLQDAIPDKFKNSPAGNLINGLLGGGAAAPAPAPASIPTPVAPVEPTTTTPAAPLAPTVPSATAPVVTPAAPAAAPATTTEAPKKKESAKQELLNGLLNQLAQ